MPRYAAIRSALDGRSKRSSGDRFGSFAAALSRARRPAYCFARRARFLYPFNCAFLSHYALSPLAALFRERHVERLQQRLSFGIRLSGRADDDVHPADLIDLVVVNFREDDLLFDAHRIVTTAIEALAIKTAEIPDARQRNRYQRSRNSYIRVRRKVTLQPTIISSRSLKPAMDFLAYVTIGFWPAMQSSRSARRPSFLVLAGFTDTHVDNDLFQTRHF